jgi:hypothetical protein
MTTTERPTAAFFLSLAGGVFILLGGLMSMFGPLGFGGMMYGFRGMMGYGYSSYGYGMMGGFGLGMFGILGLIFGVIVIISAFMLNSKPREHSTWGTLIIIFSVLSILGSARGGFGVGLILGIIGGILGITWKPPEEKR